MNEDDQNLQPWIEPELEARVVAWVLGEASAFEVAELEREVAEKPELMLFKRRVDTVHGLAGVAARPQRPELRLAPERRRKLLQTLGGAAPMPKTKVSAFRRSRPAWLTGGLLARVAACLIFVLVAVTLLSPAGSRSISATRSVAASGGITDPAAPMARKKDILIAQSNVRAPDEPRNEWKVARESLARLGAENDLAARDADVNGITKTGAGTLALTARTTVVTAGSDNITLGGANTYSGATVMNGGTLATTSDKVPAVGDVPLIGHLFRDRDGTRDTDGDVVANSAAQLTVNGAGAVHGIAVDGTFAGLPADISGDGKFSDASAAAKGQAALSDEPAEAAVVTGTITAQAGVGGGAGGGDALKMAQARTAEQAAELEKLADESKTIQEEAAPVSAPTAAAAAPAYYDSLEATTSAPAPGSPAVVADANHAMTAHSATVQSQAQAQMAQAGKDMDRLSATGDEAEFANATGNPVSQNAPVQQIEALAEAATVRTNAPAQLGLKELRPPDGPAAMELHADQQVAAAGGTAVVGFAQEEFSEKAEKPASAAVPADDYGAAPILTPTTPADIVAAAPANSVRAADSADATVAKAKLGVAALTTEGGEPLYNVAAAMPSEPRKTAASADYLSKAGSNRTITTAANAAVEDQKKQMAKSLNKEIDALDFETAENGKKPAAEANGRVSGLYAGGGRSANEDERKRVIRRELDLPLAKLSKATAAEGDKSPAPAALAPPPPPRHENELAAADQPFSTFSLHVADVSFQLAKDALARGEMPNPEQIRPEEFYNAFDYGDPAPSIGEPVACRVEQSAHPLLQQRNLVRIAMKVAAAGRNASQPLRLTILLDTSGSMEREDRAESVRRALASLASLLGPDDRVTLVGFARQPHLLAESVPGDQAAKLVEIAARTPSEGGTNLEQALNLATELADSQYVATAQNRVVLLTDGAANLGNADPAQLAKGVDKMRQHGIAFDACGVGADGLNDAILEALTRKGDGRYYFLNKPDDADAGFARQLAGAFHPAAENVKVQVRFNPRRVGKYKLLGFEQHRLNKEDFRNDKVDAAELSAEEAAVALYQVEPLPDGEGDLGEVFIRFRDPASGQMVERSWTMRYDAQAPAFDKAAPSMQLAGMADAIAERLRGDISQEDLRTLAPVVNSLRGAYPQQARVQELVGMFGQLVR